MLRIVLPRANLSIVPPRRAMRREVGVLIMCHCSKAGLEGMLVLMRALRRLWIGLGEKRGGEMDAVVVGGTYFAVRS